MTLELMTELFGSAKDKLLEHPTIKDIQAIHEKFREKDIEDWTGDELSREAGRLAVLLINLGAMNAHYRSVADFAEDSIGVDAAKETIRLIQEGVAVTRAEVQSKANTEEAKRSLGVYRYQALLMGQLYRDTERFVSVIQSRLKTMTAELKSGVGLD